MAIEKFTALTDRGTILSSELDALANGNTSGPGTEVDNSVNEDVWAVAELTVDFVTGPTARSVVQLYAVVSRDGTNYEQGGNTAGGIPPPETSLVAAFTLDDTTAAQRVMSNVFRMRGPFKHKFLLINRSGQAFPASGSIVALSTFNRDIS
jgi:hypothetical protein